MMNCREAEQLIPLFVEADLEAGEIQQVSEHLETCVACGEIAAEFQSSQSVLRAVALPAFDEAMLAEMRGAVMEQVDQTITRPVFIAWWQPLWHWKFAFAASAVILLVVGVAMSQRDGKTVDNQIAGKTKESKSAVALLREKSEPNLPDATQRPQPRTGHKPKAQGAVSGSERSLGINTRRQPRSEKAITVDNQIAAAAIAPSEVGEDVSLFPRVDTQSFTLPPVSQTENGMTRTLPTSEQSIPEPEMLRMEFQTADPNIRIIWLTPKESPRTHTITDTK